MKVLFRLFMLTAVVFALAACGKSDEEKAQDHAQSLTDEHNSLAHWFNARGTPDATWSDQELNEYEANLNHLESVENQLHDADGQDGVEIHGGNNDIQIVILRHDLERARSEKEALRHISTLHTNADSSSYSRDYTSNY